MEEENKIISLPALDGEYTLEQIAEMLFPEYHRLACRWTGDSELTFVHLVGGRIKIVRRGDDYLVCNCGNTKNPVVVKNGKFSFGPTVDWGCGFVRINYEEATE